MATPALANGPETGAQHRPSGDPPFSGSGNHGVTSVPGHAPAIGLRCMQSHQPGSEAFVQCVRDAAKALKTSFRAACKDERPRGQCVRQLAKGVRKSRSSSARRTARSACGRPDFDSRREFSRCVRVVAKGLRAAS